MTPEQEEQVRRALAAAGRDDPSGPPAGLPPEVAARLDDVLADLTAPRRARDETGTGGDVVPFADGVEARRRRRWPQVLVAAAAVSVIALAGGAVATGGFGALGGGGSATSADSASSTTQGGGERQQAPSDANGLAPKTAGGDTVAAVPSLRRAHLRGDVGRLLAGGGIAAFGLPSQRESTSASPPAPTSGHAPAAGCARPATGAGDRLVAVRLDGRPATLLLRPATGGTQEAQVYSCGDPTTPVASTTVAAR